MKPLVFAVVLALGVLTGCAVKSPERLPDMSEIHADSRGWRAASGELLDLPDLKSVDGFGVWLFATADPDWSTKSETSGPLDVKATRQVAVGGRMTILTLFSNPLPDADGNINVVVEFVQLRPDGFVSEHVPRGECLTHALVGPQVALRRCRMVFVERPTDRDLGRWRLKAVVRDMNRGVEVPVELNYLVWSAARPDLELPSR